jgi:hypothetical protein
VLDHYQIYTANDNEGRDPTNWKIYRLEDDPSGWQLIGRALHSFPFSA